MPDVVEVAETSVQLTWRANSNHGASPVVAFTVEYFSHETGQVSVHTHRVYAVIVCSLLTLFSLVWCGLLNLAASKIRLSLETRQVLAVFECSALLL